jgi:hypothetical protein
MKAINSQITPPPPRVRHSALRARVIEIIFSLIARIPLLGIISGWLKKSIIFPGIWGEAHIKSLIRKGYKPLYTTDKIAVVIVVGWALGHLENILENFSNNEYDLIYINLGAAQCVDYAKHHNCNVFSIQDVIKRKVCYQLALTSHAGIGNNQFNYGMELIAKKLIFVASLIDLDYRKHIQIERYNYVVCSGKYQSEQFQQQLDNNRLFIIGSPRFDNYKDDKEAARQAIECKTGRDICWNKKNILWLTTHGEAASCTNFAPMLSKIQSEFNIINKPHPFSYYEIYDFENCIRSLIPEIIIINDIDYINLLPAADFVICDYGSTIFSAIKVDKNVLLFNTHNPELLPGDIAPDAPVNIIRDRIINFYPDEEEKFFAALKDNDIWEKQKEMRRQIRADFFTENPNPARDIAGLCGRIVKGEV